MSDIYQDARGQLDAARGVNSVVDRDNTRDHIIASMQVDIAESLRTIAYALARRDDDTRHDNTSHEDKPRDPEVEPLEVGDLVIVNEEMRIEGEELRGNIIAIGFSEGEEVATVAWEDGTQGRRFSQYLVKVPAPETEQSDPADHVDEIDPDFTGDDHPVADAARAALSKAEKKALKKAGKS